MVLRGDAHLRKEQYRYLGLDTSTIAVFIDSSLSRIDIDVGSVRWWRGYACLRDGRFMFLLSVERYGSEHQVCE